MTGSYSTKKKSIFRTFYWIIKCGDMSWITCQSFSKKYIGHIDLKVKYLLNIDNPRFECMEGLIFPSELQLNKANASDTEE